MATIAEISSLNSRELQKKATLLGVVNSRNFSKEELLEKCKAIIEAKAAEDLANGIAPSTTKKVRVAKVTSEKVEKVAKTPIIRIKKEKVAKVKVEKVPVEMHPMEKGEFVQHYPEKRSFPITTKLLSVFKVDTGEGKSDTWIEDSEGNKIGETEHSYMKSYRAAVALKDNDPTYEGHKVVVYFKKA